MVLVMVTVPVVAWLVGPTLLFTYLPFFPSQMLSFSRNFVRSVRFWRCCLSWIGSGYAWGLDTEYINLSTVMQNNVDSARPVSFFQNTLVCHLNPPGLKNNCHSDPTLHLISSHRITPHPIISSQSLTQISLAPCSSAGHQSCPPANRRPIITPAKKEFEQAEARFGICVFLWSLTGCGPGREARRDECKTRIWTRSSNAGANVKSCSQLREGSRGKEAGGRKDT